MRAYLLVTLLCSLLMAMAITAKASAVAATSGDAKALRSIPFDSCAQMIINEAARHIDLRSHIEESTTTLQAEASGELHCFFAILPKAKRDRLALLEASVLASGNSKKKTRLISAEVNVPASSIPAEFASAAETSSFFMVELPKPIKKGEQIKLAVSQIFTRTMFPFPAQIEHADNQFVLWDDSAYYYSVYPNKKQSTTVKLASSRIESFTRLSAKKSGDEVTYGPFKDINPFQTRSISIHFVNNSPFVTFRTLSRDIEVSHWGNVAIQDNFILEHTGAKLVGPFSRFDYENSYLGQSAPSSFRMLVAELPYSANDIYYRDCIGNVSTSAVKQSGRKTIMEVFPRFPMFGGWVTDFNIGYNLPSGDYLFQAEQSKDQTENTDADSDNFKTSTASSSASDLFLLKVDFGSPFATSAVDDMDVRVILPEGAHSIEWHAPFDVDSAVFTEYKTYLDTTGRPTLILSKTNVVRQHRQPIMVSYRYSQGSILREPLLIAVAFMAFFLIVIAFYHADLRISDEKISPALLAQASPFTTTRVGTDFGERVQEVLENIMARPYGIVAASECLVGVGELPVPNSELKDKATNIVSASNIATASLETLGNEAESEQFSSTASSLSSLISNLSSATRNYSALARNSKELPAERDNIVALCKKVEQAAEKLSKN